MAHHDPQEIMDDDFHPSDHDQVIAEAEAVEQTVATQGWRLLTARLERLRLEALQNLMVTSASEAGMRWRTRLATLDEVIGLPAEFRVLREHAWQSREDEKQLKGILS